MGLTLALLFLVAGVSAQLVTPPLDSYNIDPDGVTISGVSAGQSLAVQSHVSYSSLYKGVGSAAGVAYYCSEGDLDQSLQCMNGNGPSPAYLASETLRFFDEQKIDPTTFLRESRVFILQGTLDNVVEPRNAEDVALYYLNFMNASRIENMTTMEMVHGWPTEDFGEVCDKVNLGLYINWCDYHGAYEMLQSLYRNLVRPDSSTPTPGDFYEYDQTEFHSGDSMHDVGFVYVPTGCMDKQQVCRLHVHAHGCNIGRDSVGDEYVLNTFFNHVGELNNIIILYPQVEKSVANPVNPQGCWDWWGYTDDGIDSKGDFATRDAPQTKAVYDMVQRVMGNN